MARIQVDLDAILGPTHRRIKLSNASREKLPRTFEEWCAIHGEPEYVGEGHVTWDTDILVEDHPVEKIHYDASDIISVDDKGKKTLNDIAFVDAFAAVNNCVFHNGVFYNPDGEIPPQAIRRDIARSVADLGIISRVDSYTNSLYTTLKDITSTEKLPVNEKVIPLANGDLHLGRDKWVFHHGQKKHSPYRLSVNFNPVERPMPLFNKWLTDLFVPEDILTVQEIMGYCLVPSTAAAEAFIFVGDGEAGKSGFGAILLGLLGNASTSMETQDLVTKRFQIASVENKLVAYDDDLGSAALTDTNLFKKLITADTPIRAERKYSDPHEFMSYCRIVASANFMLSSLYDDSDGFFRRLHPIYVKPKPADRKIIRNFYETILAEEKEQILKWALEGLRRVMANGWTISWSQRSRDYMKRTKSSARHFDEFFEETCLVTGDDSTVTTAEITSLYARWCKENSIDKLSDKRLANWFSSYAEKAGVHRSENLVRNGKRLRGYRGLKIRDEWKNVVII